MLNLSDSWHFLRHSIFTGIRDNCTPKYPYSMWKVTFRSTPQVYLTMALHWKTAVSDLSLFHRGKGHLGGYPGGVTTNVSFHSGDSREYLPNRWQDYLHLRCCTGWLGVTRCRLRDKKKTPCSIRPYKSLISRLTPYSAMPLHAL